MSERDDPSYDPEVDADFDDPAHEDVRRMLAGARAAGPVPAEVVTRLDATLADLVAGRAEPPEGQREGERLAPVVPLHRRMLPRLVVAAAAVVVIGGAAYAVNQMQDAAGPTSSQADGAAGGSPSRGDKSELGNAGTPGSPQGTAGSQQYNFSAAAAPELTVSGFPKDVAALLRARAAVAPDARTGPSATSSDGLPALPRATPTTLAVSSCAQPPSAGPGDQVLPVRLDGEPALLVVHPGKGGARTVQAFACADGGRLASATVPR